MADLWGFAGGFSQGQADADAHALNQGKISMLPLEKEKMGIEVQADSIALQQAKISLQQQQQILKYLQEHQRGTSTTGTGTGLGGPVDQLSQAADTHSEMLDFLGNAAAAGGKFAEAGGLFEKAATTRKVAAETQKIFWEEQQKRTEMFANALDQATPQNWEALNQQMAEQIHAPTPFMHPGPDGKMRVDPYDPHKIEWLRHMVTTAKERAQTELAKAERRKNLSDANLADTRAKYLPEQVDIARRREEAQEKRIGKSAMTPTQIRQMMQSRMSTEFTSTDSDVAKSMAWLAAAPAARAQELMEKKGLSATAAVDEAFKEAKVHGAFFGLKPNASVQERALPGMSPQNPAPQPKSIGGRKPVYVDQNWYTGKDGKVGQYRPGLDPKQPFFTQERLDKYYKDLKAHDDAE